MVSLEEKGLGASRSQPIVAEEATLSPSAILDKAADIISKPDAWTQGSYGRLGPNGMAISGIRQLLAECTCFCAYGGMAVAARKGVGLIEASSPSAFFCQAVGVEDSTDAQIWNDAKERTQAEVVAKLREAAALAREQGQ